MGTALVSAARGSVGAPRQRLPGRCEWHFIWCSCRKGTAGVTAYHVGPCTAWVYDPALASGCRASLTPLSLRHRCGFEEYEAEEGGSTVVSWSGSAVWLLVRDHDLVRACVCLVVVCRSV